MLNKKVQDAINEQIKNELYSAYLYLAMSAWCEAQTLKGGANWMRFQAGEEYGHAMKFYEFIHDRGGRVVLQALDKPPSEFKSLLDVFQQSLAHEQKVTALINKLYELALKENDYPTQTLLQWYINEQVEEEKNATEIVHKLTNARDSYGSLMFIDHQLEKRKAD